MNTENIVEEIKSSNLSESFFGYKPKSISDQVCILKEFFPEIGHLEDWVIQKLNPRAEGWFVIPCWQSVAENYWSATKIVFDILQDRHNLCFREDVFPALSYLRQSGKSDECFRQLMDLQRNPKVVLLEAQFGYSYEGVSIERFLERTKDNEFGLGIFIVGIMIITHPDRLKSPGMAGVCCPGDKFSSSFGSFNKVGRFDCDKKKFVFSLDCSSCTRSYFGIPSGFV